jgi:chromosome segregation ATPase
MSLKTFFKIGDAHTEITRLTEALAAAEQARDTALAEVTPLKEKTTALENTVATLTTERDSARTELATSQEAITAKDTEITNLKAAATTVELRAAEIAAGVGSKTAIAADPGADSAKTQEQLWSEYHALPIEQRNAFYKKHRAKLKS